MDFSLVITDLTASIHIKVNIHHICHSGDLDYPTEDDFFSHYIHLPVNFIISSFNKD